MEDFHAKAQPVSNRIIGGESPGAFPLRGERYVAVFSGYPGKNHPLGRPRFNLRLQPRFILGVKSLACGASDSSRSALPAWRTKPALPIQRGRRGPSSSAIGSGRGDQRQHGMALAARRCHSSLVPPLLDFPPRPHFASKAGQLLLYARPWEDHPHMRLLNPPVSASQRVDM
jgi:hypothetical protein